MPINKPSLLRAMKLLRPHYLKDEVLLFMDAVHPTQATKITYGWIRKGVDKIINATDSAGFKQ